MKSVVGNGSSPVLIDSFWLVGDLSRWRKRAGSTNLLSGAVALWTAQRLVVGDLVAVAVDDDGTRGGDPCGTRLRVGGHGSEFAVLRC